MFENKDYKSLVQLTQINDQSWQAVKDFVRLWQDDEIAFVNDLLVAREERYDQCGKLPDDEELLISICARVGMCRIVEELWREEDNNKENESNGS